MIFIDNRYTAIYYKIVNRALSNPITSTIYVERHHIIPESFFKNRVRLGPNGWLEGSSEDSSNIVYLTLREHAFCHKLLVKMTTGKMKSKMVLAIWRMLNGKHNKLFSSRDYEIYRKLFINCLKEVTENKKRKPLTQSHKENISIAMRGKPKTEKTKNKMKQA